VLVLIHAVADEQDMRKMGGLKIYCLFLQCDGYWFIGINGIPFFSRILFKDTILEVAYGKHKLGSFCLLFENLFFHSFLFRSFVILSF
jgi:NADH:ubiquinone oxidoreductase subunit 5 (subunit L)/multisubunit Na+/H+ antiporter MnhA subunit